MANQDGAPHIEGTVQSGFDAVRLEFERNFTQRGELGAACTIYHRGDKVVDLWGGIRDELTHSLWEEDTMVIVSSTTKGLAAIAISVAISRGLLDADQPIAAYWPEFAQNGKEKITLRMLMAHQAGLCALDNPLSFDEACDLDLRGEILARQRPAWEPGTRQGYHAVTLGWYLSEIIGRVDPEHRRLGAYFQDEVARPLGLEFYMGLPEDIPNDRIAAVHEFGLIDVLVGLPGMPLRASLGFLRKNSLTKKTFETPLPQIEDEAKRKRAYLAVEGPAYNGTGTARSIARAYSAVVCSRNELNLTPDVLKNLIEPAAAPVFGRQDAILGIDIPFSFGCCKPGSAFHFGASHQAFGMPGLGGSIGYADMSSQVGFAYTPNKWRFSLLDDPRARALDLALQQCLS